MKPEIVCAELRQELKTMHRQCLNNKASLKSVVLAEAAHGSLVS